MQPEMAKRLAEDLIGQHPDLDGWAIEFSSRAVRRLGLCIYTRKIIRLSHSFIELNGEDLIAEAVKHEIAHALTPGHGHDAVWKRMAVLVGAEPVRCARNPVLAPGPWVAVCPSCKRAFFMYRHPNPDCMRWCVACGRVNGLLHFTANLGRLNVAMRHETDRLPRRSRM